MTSYSSNSSEQVGYHCGAGDNRGTNTAQSTSASLHRRQVVLGILPGPIRSPSPGASMPILGLTYGSRQAIVAQRKLMARMSRIGMPLMGAAFVGVGALVLTGLDNIVEASLTRAMPNWLVAVTTRF